jgi:hypothetical protein
MVSRTQDTGRVLKKEEMNRQDAEDARKKRSRSPKNPHLASLASWRFLSLRWCFSAAY